MKYLILLILFSNFVFANEFDEFSETEDSQTENKFLDLSGFFEFEQGANITKTGAQRATGSDTNYVLANRRFRIDAAKTNEKGGFYAKVDLTIDQVTDKEEVEAREIRFQYKVNKYLDLSIGRQVSTWGVADMLFINDLFPKDWVANFTGRDMEWLKAPADSLRLTGYLGSFTVDTVYTPKFTPDITPTGCRFGVYDPNTNGIITNKTSCSSTTADNNSDIDDGEFAISIKKKVSDYDFSLYGYHGFYKSPKGLQLESGMLVGFHPHLSVYGASVEGQLGPGILTFETGYYDSRDDTQGDNFYIENSTLKYLVGYRMDLTSKFSFGVQGYREKIMNYTAYENSFRINNASGFDFRKKEESSTYTLRLNYKMQQETLNLSLFTYYRPDDFDSFSKLELTKKVTSDLNIAVGASVFTGKEHYLDREFGMLKDDDNVYFRLKFSF